MKNEAAFTICKCGNHYIKSSEATGTPDKVRLNVKCPPGCEIDGVHHTHPGGTCELSKGDVMAADKIIKDFQLPELKMCVTVPETGKSCCWRVK